MSEMATRGRMNGGQVPGGPSWGRDSSVLQGLPMLRTFLTQNQSHSQSKAQDKGCMWFCVSLAPLFASFHDSRCPPRSGTARASRADTPAVLVLRVSCVTGQEGCVTDTPSTSDGPRPRPVGAVGVGAGTHRVGMEASPRGLTLKQRPET